MPGPIKIVLRREPESKRGLVELRGPQGEVETCWFNLPWLDEAEWQAVFQSLELYDKDPKTWPYGEIRAKAQELGLFLGEEQACPSSDRFRIIGQTLYNVVFNSEEIRRLLDRLIHAESEPVLEFHIQDEGSLLQAYPWELLWDDEGALFEDKRAFPIRHIDFEEPVVPLELTGILRILYVAPRPECGSADLPFAERLHLEYLNCYYPDYFVLKSLPVNTLDVLQKHLIGYEEPVHVVHIDTHGAFGWLCQCHWLNPVTANQCSQCGQPRSIDRKNLGYLAFETIDGKLEWVSGEELGRRIRKRNIKLVVLSACRSALMGGASAFNSAAGALIKNQIPAVVAMQFSIKIAQAEKFVEFFYWALMRGMYLPQAVAEARMALNTDWYRPVLYLRADPSNYQGKVFEPRLQLVPPPKLTPRDRWIARLGFRRDPFRYKDGGEDHYLHEYFYFGMRHFYDIDVRAPGTAFVFGPPGSGKSSLRNVISQLCRNRGFFSIEYQDFGPLVCKYLESKELRIEDHIIQILKIALRTLAGLVDKGNVSISLQNIDERRRDIRNQLWAYVSEYEEDPLRKRSFADFLGFKLDQEAGSLPQDARELLDRFCRYVNELFGYKLFCILVDPYDGIASDEEIVWQVLAPLLSTRRLLEPSEDNLAFRFFLSQEFEERALQIPWIKQEQSRRVYRLEWPDKELRTLLQYRLWLSSGERYKSLGQLSEIEDLDDVVIQLSKGSPRELISLCDGLFSEHGRLWSPETSESLLITAQEVEEVLGQIDRKRPQSPLERLIDQGENERVEFKSTMRYNLIAKRRDEEMDREIARTICAFMNTEGGTLIIGVDDDGIALGLESDFSTLGGAKKQDAFRRAFESITRDLFSAPLLPDYYTARFDKCRGKDIYVVEIHRSKKPVYCQFGESKEFYIRKQTISQKLDVETAVEYILNHF